MDGSCMSWGVVLGVALGVAVAATCGSGRLTVEGGVTLDCADVWGLLSEPPEQIIKQMMT